MTLNTIQRKSFNTEQHSYQAYIKCFKDDFYVGSLISLSKATQELFHNVSEDKILDDIRTYIKGSDGEIKYESNFYNTY